MLRFQRVAEANYPSNFERPYDPACYDALCQGEHTVDYCKGECERHVSYRAQYIQPPNHQAKVCSGRCYNHAFYPDLEYMPNGGTLPLGSVLWFCQLERWMRVRAQRQLERTPVDFEAWREMISGIIAPREGSTLDVVHPKTGERQAWVFNKSKKLYEKSDLSPKRPRSVLSVRLDPPSCPKWIAPNQLPPWHIWETAASLR
ncbi:hypothetical protein BT69DRAFT_1320382, partial [Atractiella rhizophila]